MTPALLSLIAAAAAVTLGEQFYLSRPVRAPGPAIAIHVAYTLAVALAAGSWAAAAIFLGAGAAWRACAEWAYRRRGPSLWTGLAVAAAPYGALWLAWSFGSPAPPLAAARLLHAALAPLALTAAPSGRLLGHALLLLSAYLSCWGTATFLTRTALAGFFPQLVVVSRPREALAEVAAARDADGGRGLDRAGRLIGDLERVLILTLALAGGLTAIGFVVAAKSIARWDLARTHAEYFLIGTLTSIGIALLVGVLVRQALGGA